MLEFAVGDKHRSPVCDLIGLQVYLKRKQEVRDALQPVNCTPMKAILVTGGAGFIGSHACKALAAAGYNPVTLDNLERGHEWAVKWGPLERGDITDPKVLQRVFETWRPEAVMHFAAYAYVGESNVEPLKYYANNVGGAVNLLEACVRFSCRHFVFSSSCATYGIPAHVPLTETDPQFPINPYGYTKLVVERMLRDTDAAHGVRYVALRYFNAAGSDPDGELGELHEPETHLIPLVLLAAMGRRSSVKIFGNDYSTADGTSIRDYVHVSDLADAHVAALRWLAAGNNSDAFNLGNVPVIRPCLLAILPKPGNSSAGHQSFHLWTNRFLMRGNGFAMSCQSERKDRVATEVPDWHEIGHPSGAAAS